MSERSTATLLQLFQHQQQRNNGNRNMFLDPPDLRDVDCEQNLKMSGFHSVSTRKGMEVEMTPLAAEEASRIFVCHEDEYRNFQPHPNGNAVQFASSTGNGGTWQKNGAAASNGVINGYSMMGGFANGTSGLIHFKCSECSLTKNSCDELEIHIKTEHLNWLPFRCLKCGANRASDTQIREHMFSSHKNDKTVNLSNFGYVDNQAAKRELQSMLDRALTEAATAIAKRSGTVTTKPAQSSSAVSSPHFNPPPLKRPRLIDAEPVPSPPARAPTVTVLPRSTTDDILAQIANGLPTSESTPEGLSSITEGGEDVDDLTANQLSAFFGSKNISESHFDDFSESYVSGGAIVDNDTSLINNISALFGSNDLSVSKNEPTSSGRIFKARAPRGSRPVTCISKKRVLGECSRCQKPVTAGARQMHMFYHLGKDYNTYRFKCKFDQCDVEHYRKDQMENHQSKMHGGIDAAMMEDRSAELADMVQQLSLELLGTVGNTPGPTAERAQVLYDQQQRDAAEAQTKKKRRGGPTSVSYPPAPNSPSTSVTPNSPPPKFGAKLDSGFVKPENQKNEEFIKCNVCQKTHQKRVRGFHLLWHLSNDYGIVRYVCKHCDYKHERPQSVTTHGKREHNDANSCEDSIWRYKKEVSEISMKCYGVDQSFSKDVFKQPKVEDLLMLNEDEEGSELDENHVNGNVEDEEEAPAAKPEPRASLKADISESQGTSSASWAAKKKSKRPFGSRKPKSRAQKEQMAKLRDVSMVLGGAAYLKRRTVDICQATHCNICGAETNQRLPHHAYTHIDGNLFHCPICQTGGSSRDHVQRHLKEFHNSTQSPIDNRLRYAKEIKEAIRNCYPQHFVDAPIPTAADIERLKRSLGPDGSIHAGIDTLDMESTFDSIADPEGGQGSDAGDEQMDAQADDDHDNYDQEDPGYSNSATDEAHEAEID